MPRPNPPTPARPKPQASPPVQIPALTAPPPPLDQLTAVRELDRETYQLWLHHPVTKVVHQYLRDWVLLAQARAAQAWIAGHPLSEVERGQALGVGELTDLRYESIIERYAEHIARMENQSGE